MANRITHGAAVFVSVPALIVLLAAAARTGDPYRVFASAVFAGSLCLFYGISTLYHSLRSERARYLFRILDHAGIYLVIAASYTPFTLVSMRAGNGWILLGVVWTLAVAGIVFKSVMTHRLRFLAPVFYIALGWLIVVDLEGLLTMVPPGGVAWLFAGGVAYTVGILFYAIDRIPYNHAIWHLF
ncbi:MAG: hemolysin III family protein, partial [Desulfuromonadales bacterium]|nr:hemolysin III family protein [Desulfuromonadales bacterium]